MKITKPVDDFVDRMRAFFTRLNTPEFSKEEPYRKELYSFEQMRQLGAKIAKSHVIASGQQSDMVLDRLEKNEEVITKVYELLNEAVSGKYPIAPASEWLLDNFYLIKEQIVLGRTHLPKGYNKTLPILSKGYAAGFPRVYDIALELISHNDGHISLQTLTAFVEAYQTVTKLTLGELWAIPIMLRLAIIENIRRIASTIALDRLDKNIALYWSEQLMETAEKNPRDLIIVIAEMAKSNITLNSAFVAEFIRRQQGKGQALSMALTWLEGRLAETGSSSIEMVNVENQKQATDQVSIRNSIESIRLIKSTDWRDFVESISTVEQILKQDADGVYPQMNFTTRDRYRHVVEWISKHSNYQEYEIAQMAIDLAKANTQKNVHPRMRHVGYYLVDEEGQKELIRQSKMHITTGHRIKKILKYNRLVSYVGSALIITALLSIWTGWHAHGIGATPGFAIALGVVSFIALSQVIIVLINWISTLIVNPRPLPKMDFSKGIPDQFKTLVVVPSMLTSKKGVEELVDELEVRYLANPEDNLYFALLTDFADAKQEHMPGDELLLTYAKKLITRLNQTYQNTKESGSKFFLFHRPRKWNSAEKVWMGHERKRGKLAEINSFLRKTGHDDFAEIVGDTTSLENIKYIITLDADTQLPLEAAWKLIASMAHPLNQPVIGTGKKYVSDGYGILQPRTAVSIPKSDSSIYARIHSEDAGLDPYTRLVSDVYQDLFSEGSFIGKGIYDIDTFENVLGSAFPPNRILSHDLLEGSYVRSGLLTDVELYEDYPETYWADMSRRHRWIRGDWQIASWGTPFVPGKNNRLQRNFISSLSRWKIWDNIRRSLVAPAMIVFLIIGWLLIPKPALWTLLFMAAWLLPPILTGIWQLFRKHESVGWKTHLSEVKGDTIGVILHIFFNIACLPFEAVQNLDAIFKSNWRMLFSHKKLLQWTPSKSSRSQQKNLQQSYAYMWPSVVVPIIIGIFILIFNPSVIFVAAPILLLWMAAPAIAWWVSKPAGKMSADLSVQNQELLRRYARKTWSYFEEFVTEKDNWLAPDNFQEQPVESLAHRTSPTNIGLALLSNFSAYDLGYASITTLVSRTQKTFETLHKLERYNGHFYNWYDTESLVPLHPKYVSTVDSGNFVAGLIVLKQGLKDLSSEKIFKPEHAVGLLDTILVISSLFEKKDIPDEIKHLQAFINKLIDAPGASLSLIYDTLKQTGPVVSILREKYAANENNQVLQWLQRFDAQLESHIAALEFFTPWLTQKALTGDTEPAEWLMVVPSLNELVQCPEKIKESISDFKSFTENNLSEAIALAASRAADFIKQLVALEEDCVNFSTVEYNFLYNRAQNLFHIGFNVSADEIDKSYYDMLASEARLGIYTAIAQGKVPQAAWFALGRLVTNMNNHPTLLSWSGSMFEYLMPQLLMPAYENTLLDRSNKGAVNNQINYGNKKNVPWGISESGYNLIDASLHYQYQSFGVPGLGLKRGLANDLVIAPYASAMALMVTPEAAVENLKTLSKKGFEGNYGFYEAIDYTTSRMPHGQSHAIVKSFMVHHLGMSLLSFAYVLCNKKMQERFAREPQLQAALLLLQEKSPRTTNFYTHTEESGERSVTAPQTQMRVLNTPNTNVPEVQLLSNGRYSLLITNSGGGYSRWNALALSRWREDTTLDNWGVFCYIKELSSGKFWSNTYQPTQKKGKAYETIFSMGHVEFKRIDESFETKTEIVVSPEDDVEIRRIKITNRSAGSKTLEVTSYTEIVIADQSADEAHPAFSNLFVQTEIDENAGAILSTRRPRSKDSRPPWMFHTLSLYGADSENISYETNRSNFVGRGRTIISPEALHKDGPLSNTQGSVLDPIASIRHRVTLKPRQTITIDLIIGIADSKEHCLELINKFRDRYIKNRVFELAWTHSQVTLRQINATETEAQLFNTIAGSIVYANNNYRADASIIESNLKGQAGLWSYAISGDLPIVLVKIKNSDNIELVKQLIKAHAFWALKGLKVDLVIWNDDFGSYRQVFHDQIIGYITATSGSNIDQPGGVFVRSGDQISNEDRILFQTVARLIFDDEKGSLAEQIAQKKTVKGFPEAFTPQAQVNKYPDDAAMALPEYLLFNNGIGGFTKDGKEYILLTDGTQKTPAPWCNMIANKEIGSIVSESGAAYTWVDNAQMFRLTPWKNDPVSDGSGEACFIRDEESGQFWSTAPFPQPSKNGYLVRHGFGYSVYETVQTGIRSEMWVYVDKDLPVKFTVLKIKNQSAYDRKLSVTGYVEIVMGDTAPKNKMFIVAQRDLQSGVLFIKNRYNTTFMDKVAFFDTDQSNFTFTCDRTEFIGRNGTLERPEAMLRKQLSGRNGAGLDPCVAIQIPITIPAGEEREIIFRLGAGKNEQETRELVSQLKGAEFAHTAQSRVHDQWNEILGAVTVNTPNDALNVLTNGWWLYQTLACRIWGRSGFYQSGGAFGFRDQLQDVLAVMHTRPDVTRDQILLAASRQFPQGDVQHWWHPPSGRGVRTTCSDDYLWLPYVTARYVNLTGDNSILEEYVSFIDGRPLRPDEDSYYDLPVQLNHWETLYNHCKHSINHGLRFGQHGLPLMGSGDWNDGMDRVGDKGKGESVWLAFFLYDVLIHFEKIAQLMGDTDFVATCTNEAIKLKENIRKNGWDGDWYRRAYFDDGTPLGSSSNEECKIDSISQSWSVLSTGGDQERSIQGMDALNKYLVDRKNGIIKLLSPPFDKSDLYPGYIKGYLPGVRENGGQYTHAAIWTIMAFAAMHNKERVWELFNIVNPVNHALTPEKVHQYKVEPYVMAADVYGAPPHEGRGGWTWYTGSAGWTYQLVIQSILGINRVNDKLYLNPVVPDEWNDYEIRYQFGKSSYLLKVKNIRKDGSIRFLENGNELSDKFVNLVDDGAQRIIEVEI